MSKSELQKIYDEPKSQSGVQELAPSEASPDAAEKAAGNEEIGEN